MKIFLLIFHLNYFLSFTTETIRERNDPNAKLKNISNEAKASLAELEKTFVAKEAMSEVVKPTPDKFNAVSRQSFFELIFNERFQLIFRNTKLF